MEGKRARKNLWCRVVLAVCAVLVGFILPAGEAGAYVQDDLDYLLMIWETAA